MLHDLKFALRSLAKSPVLSLVVIVSLGLGLGVNTIVFSWMQSIVLEPVRGVAKSAELITLEPRSTSGGFPGLAWTEYREFRERSTAFAELFAYRAVPFYAGQPGSVERTPGMLVSDNYFSALNLKPALGRFFQREETTAGGGSPVAVISFDYWQRRFGGSREVLGQTLPVNGLGVTIVGVGPAGFVGTAVGLAYDLWLPVASAPVIFPGTRELEARSYRGYSALGRLKPGATPAQAATEFGGYMKELAGVYPESNATLTGIAVPFWRAPRGAQTFFGNALLGLQGMMLLVLLLVCANTANLLLARASARRQEIGVRMALGAGTWRIVQQLAVEGLVLAVLAAAFGAVFASWGNEAFRAMPLIGALPVKFVTTVDWLGLGFAVTLAVICTLGFSLFPALQLARTDVRAALNSSAGGGMPGRRRFGGALVGAEAAIAFLVLVMAAAFLKDLNDERQGNAGFRTDGIVMTGYDLSGRGYDTAAIKRFNRDLLAGLRAVPGVQGAALAGAVPLDLHGLSSTPLSLEGRASSKDKPDTALSYAVSPGYFDVMGLALTSGTDFADLDDTAAPQQAVVNREFVRRYLGDAPALGRKVDVRGSVFEIVGVVADAKYNSLAETPQPVLYLSYRDRPRGGGDIHLHTTLSAADSATAVRAVIQRLEPRIAPFDVRTFSEHVEKNLFLRRIPARLFAVVGPFALLLAAIGIYAVVAQAVSQRTREIGVRLAIGASPRQVVGELLLRNLRPVVIGLGVAWALVGVAALRLPANRLPSLPLQLATLVALAAIAVLAAWWPARRAAKTDPLIALRAE